MKKGILMGIGFLFCHCLVFGQAEDKREAYRDSIKASEWPYKLPVWGKRITKRGVDLPYPFGVMVNYMFASQKVNITDLQVGINDAPMVPLNFVKFGEVKANVQTLNSRIDVWAIPFIDFYAILGKTWASTEVTVVAPIQFTNKVHFNGSTLGMGMTFGGAYKHVFGTLDYNHTWTRFDEIEGSIHTQVLSPRFGYTFESKRRPQSNFGVWIGGSGIFINRITEGTINLSDLDVNGNAADFNIENTTWYQNLGPAQQVVAKQLADKIKDKINNIDVSDTTIHYSLKKRPVSNWSMAIGGQYQLNHNFQFRTEFGFLGGRTSLLASVNYRFGL